MKLKSLSILAIAPIFSLALVTACANPCAGKTKTDGVENQADPCAGKKDPCAAKKDPCASKKDPCAGK